MIKKYSTYLAAAFVAVASACSDDLDVIIPEPDNITFNEIQMPDRFTHVITDGGFSVSGSQFQCCQVGLAARRRILCQQPQLPPVCRGRR